MFTASQSLIDHAITTAGQSGRAFWKKWILLIPTVWRAIWRLYERVKSVIPSVDGRFLRPISRPLMS